MYSCTGTQQNGLYVSAPLKLGPTAKDKQANPVKKQTESQPPDH